MKSGVFAIAISGFLSAEELILHIADGVGGWHGSQRGVSTDCL